MCLLLKNATTERDLLPLVRVLALVFYVLPLLRLLCFRLTGIIIPISVLMAPVLLVNLFLVALSARNIRIGQLGVSIQFLLSVPLVVYLSMSIRSNSLGVLLGSAWIYFFAPVVLVVTGCIAGSNQRPISPKAARRRIDRWVGVSITCLMLGIAVNALDALLLGEGYFAAYENYSSAVPAIFGEYSLPRLAGAYFSGLDLTFAAIILLAVQAQRTQRQSPLINGLIYLAIALTFTRNAYVILAVWLLVRRLSPRGLSRFSAVGYMAMPFASIVIALYLAAQVASGQLEPSAETSSVLTRLASWELISRMLLGSATSLLAGLGLTQNALTPGESDVYAIDNFFWELLSYAGLVAFLSYGLIFWLIRKKAMHIKSNVGKIALSIVSILPVAGIFNNMAGTMLAYALFLSCGMISTIVRHGK